MIRSLDIAGTAMLAHQTNVDNISNNIANANTTGFKRGVINFGDLLYQNVVAAGANSSQSGTTIPAGITIGSGVRIMSLFKEFEQGALQSTPGAPLNWAISGDGLFQITLPDGETAYTRDGSFNQSSTGEIVTALGYPLSPSISLPANATDITVSQSGDITVRVNNILTPIATLQIAHFTNEAGLIPISNNLYIASEASGSVVTGTPNTSGFGSISQNNLEQSNVNTIQEITDLVTAQRAFEYSSKVMQTSDQMLRVIADIKA